MRPPGHRVVLTSAIALAIAAVSGCAGGSSPRRTATVSGDQLQQSAPATLLALPPETLASTAPLTAVPPQAEVRSFLQLRRRYAAAIMASEKTEALGLFLARTRRTAAAVVSRDSAIKRGAPEAFADREVRVVLAGQGPLWPAAQAARLSAPERARLVALARAHASAAALVVTTVSGDRHTQFAVRDGGTFRLVP